MAEFYIRKQNTFEIYTPRLHKTQFFTEEKDSTFKNEPIKHQNFEPNSKYDIDKTNYNSYQDFTGDDNISIDSKRHHPRALEDVASYKYEI